MIVLLLISILFFLGVISAAINVLVLAYIFLFFAISLVPYLKRSQKILGVDPFEPYNGLTILFFLYGLSTIIYVSNNNATYYNETVTKSAYAEYILACLIGQLGLAFGALIAQNKLINKNNIKMQVINRIERKILLGPFLLLATIMLPFYYEKFNFLDVVSYSEAAFSTRIARSQDEAAGIKEILLRDPYILIIISAAVIRFFGKGSLLIKVISSAIVISYSLASLLSGWRGELMFVIITTIIYYHYKKHRISLRYAFLGGVLTYILINSLSIMRAAPNADIFSMIELLRNNFAEAGIDFLQLSSSGELSTSTNLLRLIMGIQNGEINFSMGHTLLSQFGAFVPRALWPERPPIASELFVQTFYPGVYESGGGYGLFFHQEGYWDFGLFGVFIYSAILAFLTRKLYFRLIGNNKGDVAVLLYGVLYGQMVLSVVRSGFISSIKASLLVALPLILIMALARYLVSLSDKGVEELK